MKNFFYDELEESFANFANDFEKQSIDEYNAGNNELYIALVDSAIYSQHLSDCMKRLKKLKINDYDPEKVKFKNFPCIMDIETKVL